MHTSLSSTWVSTNVIHGNAPQSSVSPRSSLLEGIKVYGFFFLSSSHNDLSTHGVPARSCQSFSLELFIADDRDNLNLPLATPQDKKIVVDDVLGHKLCRCFFGRNVGNTVVHLSFPIRLSANIHPASVDEPLTPHCVLRRVQLNRESGLMAASSLETVEEPPGSRSWSACPAALHACSIEGGGLLAARLL